MGRNQSNLEFETEEKSCKSSCKGRGLRDSNKWTMTKFNFLTTTLTAFVVLSLAVSKPIAGGLVIGDEPMFTDDIENITVPAGREVKLSCSVKNLGNHKVAWIHFEGSAILTVQTHVITRNPRIKVTHDKHRTWYLHIEDVQPSDAGRYMCQINTETAKTKIGFLHVVVPPNIDDSMSSSDVIVRENANVSLFCHATGSPKPNIKWQREDKQEIRINKTFSVRELEGNSLELSKISRIDMGGFFCIASNGIPPTVSKRIKVSVDFSPAIEISHQLIGTPYYSKATIECTSEAHPASLNYWTRDDGNMIHNSDKHRTQFEVGNPSYKTHMKLTIYNITEPDLGNYRCVAKNPRGETEGTIKIYATTPSTTTTIATTTIRIHKKHKDQRERKELSGRTSSLAGGFNEKGSSGYQSSLNTVDKSEQRSTKSSATAKGDGYWPEGDDVNSKSSKSSELRTLFQLPVTLFLWTLVTLFLIL